MSATNLFASHAIGTTSPPTHHAAITPNDSSDLAYVAREIYVGTGGDLKVTTTMGETATYPNVPSGFLLCGFFTRVLATGTTASGLVGRW